MNFLITPNQFPTTLKINQKSIIIPLNLVQKTGQATQVIRSPILVIFIWVRLEIMGTIIGV